VKQNEKTVTREADMQIFAIPAFPETISMIRITEAGTPHRTQCPSVTVRVWKSDRAAEDMHRTRSEILTVDRRGSGMFTGNGLLASRLLRYRYAPDWNRPTD